MTRAEALEELATLLEMDRDTDAVGLTSRGRDAVRFALTSLQVDESLCLADRARDPVAESSWRGSPRLCAEFRDWALRDAVHCDVRETRRGDFIEKGGI